MEAIDKVRDTSTSHERCSIIEVMGRNAGYLAMWCGIANGAEDVLIPEKYDYDEQKLINNIIASRKAGKKHHIIINACLLYTSCEVYVAPGSRFDREAGSGEDRYYHLVLLAENNQGYSNLMKIVSKGFVEGFYYKPVSYTHLDVYKRQF